jgi:hypothetical protein
MVAGPIYFPSSPASLSAFIVFVFSIMATLTGEMGSQLSFLTEIFLTSLFIINQSWKQPNVVH